MTDVGLEGDDVRLNSFVTDQTKGCLRRRYVVSSCSVDTGKERSTYTHDESSNEITERDERITITRFRFRDRILGDLQQQDQY